LACRRCYQWTVDPSSDLYYRWLAVITLAVVYNLTIIVARTVLPDLQDMYRPVWITLDYVCDLVYVMDVVVRFRTSEYVSTSSALSPVHTSDNVAKNGDIVAKNGDIVASVDGALRYVHTACSALRCGQYRRQSSK